MKTFKRNKFTDGKKRVLAVFYPGARSEWSTISYIRKLKNQHDIELHLLFVVPKIPAQYYQINATNDVAQEQWQTAETALNQIAQMLNVPNDRRWIMDGNVLGETYWLAKHLDADEIVGNNRLIKLRCRLQKLIGFIANEPAGPPTYKKCRLISAR